MGLMLVVSCLPVAYGQDANVGGAMDAESAKRLAATEEAIELLRKGDEAIGERKYDVAVEIYAGVRDMLPVAPVTEELRASATERYAVASIALAETLLIDGDLAGAKKQVGMVLSENVAPNHVAATAMMKRLNDPIATNQAANKELGEDVNEVLRLLTLAGGAMAIADFDKAEKSYHKILHIDPHNKAARRGLVSVVEAKRGASRVAYDHTRAEFLMAVDAAWELQLDPLDEVPVYDRLRQPDEYAPSMGIATKLDRIFIPMVALDQVTLSEAVEFLRAMSIREDTFATDDKSRGINFTINVGDPEQEANKQLLDQRFNLQLKNVPISEVLRYINDLTKTKYKVEDYAVVIKRRGSVSTDVVTRDYRVPPGFLASLSSNSAGPANNDPFAETSGAGGLLTEQLSVREVLERQGVSFPDGAAVSYTPSVNLLRLVNTEINHNLVEAIVESVLKTEPVVVSVQVTMIRTQQTNLKELGFDWLITPMDLKGGNFLSGGTPGSMPGRANTDFSSTISLPPTPGATVTDGVLTNSLRSGDQGFTSGKLDAIVNNFDRDVQETQVAPGILSLTNIFNEGEAQVMLRGLDQKKGVDVMINPSVVTKSSQSAKIQLIRELIYPTEYDPPELQTGGGGTGGSGAFPVVPANPTAFDMREVGVSLEVLPVAGPDKTYVDVTLNPSLVALEGFVNFGSPIDTALSDADGNPVAVTLTENSILMPVFNTQQLTTQLTVADGATIAFGGLMSESIENFNDQVPIIGSIPLIGRFFQSEGARPISTAVIFLVKVDLMDPTGRLYRDR